MVLPNGVHENATEEVRGEAERTAVGEAASTRALGEAISQDPEYYRKHGPWLLMWRYLQWGSLPEDRPAIGAWLRRHRA